MMVVNKYRAVAVLLLLAPLVSLPAVAHSKKTVTGKVVDSGTFGVYIRGKRVAEEKFDIVQSPDMSVATAELHLDQNKETQKAVMQLAPNGNLIRYEWSENGKGHLVVEPKNEFLVEHVTLENPQKSAEQPYVLPVSTMVLDDGFFSQRELLLWRYLATTCELKPGAKGCALKPQQYGVIIPRQQTSAQVTVSYSGSQKVNIRGNDMNLQRFDLHGDGYDWTIWIDSSYKIQKISINQENTEIYRE